MWRFLKLDLGVIYRLDSVRTGAYCAFEEIPRHWGVMTLKGKVIVDAKYEKVEIRDNGIAVVTGITGKTQTIKLLKVKE